jgi:hypothetical protein
MSGVNDLGASYAAWRALPFPPGSADDELDEIHADLALADHWVAESVIPFVEHGRHEPARPDVLAEVTHLITRAQGRERAGNTERINLARQYRAYAMSLLCVYTDFLCCEK